MVAIILAGCSGILPSLSPRGYVVEPEYLGGYTRGGSMSTLWYHGSDARYHYFSHLFKVTTNYRVERKKLHLDEKNEFAYGSKEPVFASPMVARALKKQRTLDGCVAR